MKYLFEVPVAIALTKEQLKTLASNQGKSLSLEGEETEQIIREECNRILKSFFNGELVSKYDFDAIMAENEKLQSKLKQFKKENESLSSSLEKYEDSDEGWDLPEYHRRKAKPDGWDK